MICLSILHLRRTQSLGKDNHTAIQSLNVVQCEHRIISLQADLVHKLWSWTVLGFWCTANEAHERRNKAVSSSGRLHRNANVKYQ